MTTVSFIKPESERQARQMALQLLRRLARNGGHLIHCRVRPPQDACEADEHFLMFSPRNGHRRPLARIDATLVARMIAAGWLEEANGRWRPSPHGRAVLAGQAPGDLPAADPAAAMRTVSESERVIDGEKRRVTERQGETPLAWLARHRDSRGNPFLSPEEMEAADILRRDYEQAAFGQRVTMSWDAAMTIGERRRMRRQATDLTTMEAVVAARQRLRRALMAVGPGLDEIVLEVVCLSRGLEAAERRLGWPRRAGKLALKLALTRLARHYGLTQEPPEERAVRILAWALPDGHPTQALPDDMQPPS